MSDGEGGGKWEIVRELEKQFEVIAVNPSQPILKSDPAEPKPEGEADAEKKDEEKQDDNIPAEGFEFDAQPLRQPLADRQAVPPLDTA